MGDKALVNKSESDKLTLASLRRNDNTIEEVRHASAPAPTPTPPLALTRPATRATSAAAASPLLPFSPLVRDSQSGHSLTLSAVSFDRVSLALLLFHS